MSIGACGEFIKSQITENFYEEYKKTSVFIYAICNKTETFALTYIQRVKESSGFHQRKDRRFTPFKFTALMATAWMRMPKISKCLLGAGANPMIEDARGNNFFDYLAMVPTPENLEILSEYAENLTSDKVGITWKKILETRQLPDPSKQSFFYSQEGIIKEGDGNKFVELTAPSGAEYFLEAPYLNELQLLERWKRRQQTDSVQQNQFENDLQKAYNKFEKDSSSPLYMEYHPIEGWTIRARRDIKRGEFVARFCGEQVSDEEKRSLFALNTKIQSIQKFYLKRGYLVRKDFLYSS